MALTRGDFDGATTAQSAHQERDCEDRVEWGGPICSHTIRQFTRTDGPNTEC